MKYLAGCRVHDFGELARLCQLDPTFPKTEAEWSQLVAAADSTATAEGYATTAVTVVLPDFQQWCSVVGIVPCLDALRAYLIVKRTQAQLPASLAPTRLS